MLNSSYARTNIIILLVILASSAVTMLWLFWHHPWPTSIATAAVLAALGIAARLARSSDTDGISDVDATKQGVQTR
jgi:hypothetical protein